MPSPCPKSISLYDGLLSELLARGRLGGPRMGRGEREARQGSDISVAEMVVRAAAGKAGTDGSESAAC